MAGYTIGAGVMRLILPNAQVFTLMKFCLKSCNLETYTILQGYLRVRKRLFRLMLSLLVSSCWTAPGCLATSDTDINADVVVALERSQVSVPVSHPVLHVRPHERLGRKALTAKVFHRLNGELKANALKIWDDSYEVAEEEAADQFCNKVKGLTTVAVERLIGAPASKGGDKISFPVRANNEKCWLYVLGVTPQLVRLIFENGICKEAWFSPYDMDIWYAQWRKSEITNFAVGKNITDIIEAEGAPDNIIVYSKGPNQRVSAVAPPEKLSSTEKIDFWKKFLIYDNCRLQYYVGNSSYVGLVFCDGRCTYISEHELLKCGGSMDDRHVMALHFGPPVAVLAGIFGRSAYMMRVFCSTRARAGEMAFKMP